MFDIKQPFDYSSLRFPWAFQYTVTVCMAKSWRIDSHRNFQNKNIPQFNENWNETDTLLGTNSSVLNIGLHGPQKKGSSPIPPFFKGKLFVLGMENSSSSCFSLTTLFKHTRHQTPLRRKDWLNERAKNPKEFNKNIFFLMCKCHVSGLKKFFRSQKDMPGKTKASVDSFMDPEEMDVRWWIQYSVFQYF